MKLFFSQGQQVAKASVSNGQVNFVLKVANSNATKRPPVNSYLAAHPDAEPEKGKNLLCVLLYAGWSHLATCPSVPAVVPHEAVDLLVQEKLKVVSVRIIDHILVSHCVRITKNYSIKFQKPLILRI